jgi:hypothetical protein
MKAWELLAFLVLVWAGAARGAPPDLKLQGPEQPPAAGRLAVVSAATTGRQVAWVLPDGVDSAADTTGRTVALVFPTPGTYRIVAITSLNDELAKAELTIRVAGGPGPVPPAPQPDPKPKPGAKLWGVVVVEETADASATRAAFFLDAALSQHLRANHLKWRVADIHTTDKDGQPPKDLAPYLARAKGQTLPRVYAVTETGEMVFEGAVPATAGELVSLLKKLGGQP